MIWMTREKKFKSTWEEFAELLGYPIQEEEEANGWKVHIQPNASKPDVLAPLYIPGWGKVGNIAHLTPTMDIMNRVYLNTIAPKSGNYDQIHAWSIDLMMLTHQNMNTHTKLDVINVMRCAMWMAIVERSSAPYAPYVQMLINRKWFEATGTHYDQLFEDDLTIHKPKSLMVKHHEAPRSMEARLAAEEAEAAVIREARLAGTKPPRRARARAHASAADAAAFGVPQGPPPSPPRPAMR